MNSRLTLMQMLNALKTDLLKNNILESEQEIFPNKWDLLEPQSLLINELIEKLLNQPDEDYTQYIKIKLEMSGVLNNCTASYKFFWFKAIVHEIKKQDKDNLPILYFDDLFLNMLNDVFYMVNANKISLGNPVGKQDVLEKTAKEIITLENFADIKNNYENEKYQQPVDSKTIAQKMNLIEPKIIKKINKTLEKNVPYAFLKSFESSKNRIPIRKNGEINKTQVAEWTSKNKKSVPYTFGIDSNGKFIHLTEKWFLFIKENPEIVESFISEKLTKWLEKRNPMLPNISQKLWFESYQRDSLNSYYKKWQDYQNDKNVIIDFLDNNTIDLNATPKPAIDHFIPWKFVHNNVSWNLSPISNKNNSIKNAKVILNDSIINRFVSQQYNFYQFLHRHYLNTEIFNEYYYLLHNQNVQKHNFEHILKDEITNLSKNAIRCGFQKYI